MTVLFLGRVLGGISGTLLWSVFESWLVAEFNKLMLENSEPLLSGIFSTMTTSNTCVAIVAGIVAGWLVDRFGTAKAPFLASIGCLSVAFVAISNYWVSASVMRARRLCLTSYRAKIMDPVTAMELKPRHSFRKKLSLQPHHYRHCE